MGEDDNVVRFPGSKRPHTPDEDLKLEPDAYALIQLVDGRLLTSYKTDNLLELLGMVNMLHEEILDMTFSKSSEPPQ